MRSQRKPLIYTSFIKPHIFNRNFCYKIIPILIMRLVSKLIPIFCTLFKCTLGIMENVEIPFFLAPKDSSNSRITLHGNQGHNPTHLVKLHYYDKPVCVGALVTTPNNTQLLLTTAECVTDRSPNRLFRELLAYHLAAFSNRNHSSDNYNAAEQHSSIYGIHRFPAWNPIQGEDQYNLAVIFLNQEFKPNQFLQPIPYKDLKLTEDQLKFVKTASMSKPPLVTPETEKDKLVAENDPRVYLNLHSKGSDGIRKIVKRSLNTG